jgi:hypothetical protein
MILICGLPCDKSFTNQRGLNNHRNSCQVYQQNHVRAVEQRKERLLIKKQKAKQKAQNAPSVDDTAAASIQSESSQAPLTDIQVVTALAVEGEVRFFINPTQFLVFMIHTDNSNIVTCQCRCQ